MISNRRSLLYLLFVTFACSTPALAYIDPGIVSLVMQWVYIGAAGAVAFLFGNPIQYIKALFSKKPADADLNSPTPTLETKND